jgi:type IV secretion system protein VirB4
VPAELVAVAGRLNNAFRRLGSGWADLRRGAASRRRTYPASMFPTALPAWSMPSARPISRKPGAHFESSYFLTFLYLPPAEDAARAETWLYEGRDRMPASMRTRSCAALHRSHRSHPATHRRLHAGMRLAR